jgi:hypothetical protein
MAFSAFRSTRNLRASLLYHLHRGRHRKDVQSFLFSLLPYRTAHRLIRIGGNNDGGYLLPDDLNGLVACFSPGVSETITFDLEIMERGIPCFLADASVDGLVQDHPLATLDKLFVGPRTEGDFISLDDWVARYAPPEGDMLLQMDIEGAEYDTLQATDEKTLGRFRIIVLELHGLHRVFRPEKLQDYRAVMGKLLRQFKVVHTHVNNVSRMVSAAGIDVAPLLELTLLRNDRVTGAELNHDLPHILDEKNLITHQDYSVPGAWFSYRNS